MKKSKLLIIFNRNIVEKVENKKIMKKFPKFLSFKRMKGRIDLFEEYLHKKLSIEYVLEKLLEIEKIQFLLLNENELHFFKKLLNPQVLSKEETYIQNLYNKFEFYDRRNQNTLILEPNKPSYENLLKMMNSNYEE
jgi:hypothetical protein